MTAFVVGFAFDQLQKVWLIRKIKPDWQAGKLNGIGGKIEPHETPTEAMVREFQEEAGLYIPGQRWVRFHHEQWDSGNSVHFFATRLFPHEKPMTMEAEKIESLSWIVLSYPEWRDVLYNLPYLVPMAYSYLLENPNFYPAHQPKEGNS